MAEAEVLPLREEALHQLRCVPSTPVPGAHEYRVQYLKGMKIQFGSTEFNLGTKLRSEAR